jgi:hypothetical protein
MRALLRPQELTPAMNAVRSGKANEGMMRVERRHDDLADIAFRHRITRAGTHDLDDDVLVHHKAFAGGGLVGDEAQIGRCIGLIGLDAPGGELVLQRFRKSGSRHERAPDRRDIPPGR